MPQRFLSFITAIVLLSLTLNLKAQKSQVILARNSVGKLQVSFLKKEEAKAQLSIIGEGIKAIDAALKDKKTRNWPEVWAIKSYLSSYVAILDPSESNGLKYYELAIKSIDTARILDKFQANTALIKAAIQNINVKKLNEGTKAFNRNDFITAFNTLREVSDYIPKDTALAINVAISAQHIQAYDEALRYLLRAKEGGVVNPTVYQNMAMLYAFKFENDLAIRALEDGLKLNPQHNFLMNDYINLLLDNEKYDKAAKAIESTFINERRSTRLLYYLYGYVQQTQLKNNTLAEAAYQHALRYDQDYFEALYQLALIYIENANSALKQHEQQNFTALINRAEFTLLNAYEINPNDVNTIQLLAEIYLRKNRLDKVQEFKRKLNGL